MVPSPGGAQVPGDVVTEFTFTLIPEHDPDADVALIAYAKAVRGKNPQLADGILRALHEAQGIRMQGRLVRDGIERKQR